LRILFDTSVAIAFRDGDPHILARARHIDPVAVISAVTWVELEGGVGVAPEGMAARRAALDAMRDVLDILAFGPDEARIYGRIVEALGFSRRKIIDRMIAAQAISAGACLATLNPRDFRDIPDLRIEDWSA
jgi:tRNA(fMet)-specific endonuclease VapC